MARPDQWAGHPVVPTPAPRSRVPAPRKRCASRSPRWNRKIGAAGGMNWMLKRAFRRVKESNQAIGSAGATAYLRQEIRAVNLQREGFFSDRGGVPADCAPAAPASTATIKNTSRARPTWNCATRFRKSRSRKSRCYGCRRWRDRRTAPAGLGRQIRKRVLQLMRADNLLALRKRRYVWTTDSHHPFAIYPQPGAASGGEWSQPALGGGYHVHPPARDVFVPGGDSGCALGAKAVGWELGDTLEASLASGGAPTCAGPSRH